jgi:hypothetical protein
MGLYKPVIVKKIVNDEHYYYVDEKFYPSVTHILGETLPMPFAVKQWIGDMGNERAQQKLEKAGDIGTAIHDACEKLLTGHQINLKVEFPVRAQKKMLVGFVNWFSQYEPRLIRDTTPELVLASKYGYAGTLDLPVVINGTPFIVDIKTSRGVYDSHKLQLAAYRQAFLEMYGIECGIAVLHLNPMTRSGFTFYTTEKLDIMGKLVDIKDFLAVLELYKVLHGGKIPEPSLEDDYPEILKLGALAIEVEE